MKIEEGKFYRTRDGQKVGPMAYFKHESVFPWRGDVITGAGDAYPVTLSFMCDGYYTAGLLPRGFDLVAEWVDDITDYPPIDDRTVMNGGSEKVTPALVERAAILDEARNLTTSTRQADYGPPSVNFACAAELKTVFRKHMKRDISPAEMEALDMLFTKLGRIATGTAKRDNYVDAAGYVALAGEIALAATPGLS